MIRRIGYGLLVATAAIVFFGLLAVVGVILGLIYAMIAGFVALAIWAA